MGTILESVNNLSEKLGVTKREQTIKDQLDLCVERLGGEGNSVDIAESANKFADKEDGTATFTTKTITENDTYDAADDGVSGYSSVTVNVPAPVLIEKTITANNTYNAADDSADGYSSVTVDVPLTISSVSTKIRPEGDYLRKFDILSSSNGIYDLGANDTPYNDYIVLLTPAKKIIYANNGGQCITFTPDEEYDGIYNGTSGNKITFATEVTGGDGKTYGFRNQAMGGPTLIKYDDTDFTVTIS